MSLGERLWRFRMERRGRSVRPMKVIALVFGAIILLGAALLTLPGASRNGVSCGFLPALFTATSATCVTGLVLFDTYSQWSGFGQTVILLLIQVGGLGFMSAATLFVTGLRRRASLKQRMVMAQALSVSDMDGILSLQTMVLRGGFAIEGIGAAILFLRFLPEFGFRKALKWSVFHSVSAFCNAGFDIFGCITPGASLMEFQSDPVVLLTLGALVILGGLGFLVWQELWEKRSFRKLSVYARLVLVTTLGLLLAGWAVICLLEWNNPGTLGALGTGDKLLNGLFQSVTLRTAGFASLDQGALTDAGKAFCMVLMLVGGASGSTAGGLKTVSFVVLVLFLAARARGRETVTVYKRTIPTGQVLDAMTIAAIMVGLAFFGGIFISATSPMGLADALYESVSAIATVGLSASGSGNLSIPARILIILYMYFGRVGVLTISMGFLAGDRAEERFRYAETRLLIG